MTPDATDPQAPSLPHRKSTRASSLPTSATRAGDGSVAVGVLSLVIGDPAID